MARNKHPLMRLQGTIGGITFVASQAYKDHIRSPRGTKKEAPLNETLKKNSEATEPINLKAKVVHDELKVLSGKFKQGSLWSRLLSRLRKARSLSVCDLISSLEGVEINERYKLERFCGVPEAAIIKKGKKALVDIHFVSKPVFDHSLDADSFRYELNVLWIDKEMKRCEPDGVRTDWVMSDRTDFKRRESFDLPTWAAFYVLVLNIRGGSNGKAIEHFLAEGMRVIKTGKVR